MTTRQPLSPKMGFANTLHMADGRSVHDAQHAPYLVAASLHELGMVDWLPRVFAFLRMYDGVARWMETGMPEAACMADLDLREEVMRKRSGATQPEQDPAALRFRLAVLLTNSPVTLFGARWKLERRFKDLPMDIPWNPLEQPWLTFLGQHIVLPDHATLHINRKGRQIRQQLMAYLLER